MHSLYGYLGSPSPRNARRIVRRLAGITSGLDATTLEVVGGQNQLKSTFATDVWSSLANLSYEVMPAPTSTAPGTTDDVAVYRGVATLPQQGNDLATALRARKPANIPVAVSLTAAQHLVNPAVTRENGTPLTDEEKTFYVYVPRNKAGTATLALLTQAAGSTDLAYLVPPKAAGANTQTNLASSGGDGGGTIVLVGLAAVAAIALAMSAGKKTPAVANPMHRMNRHVPTVRVSM